MKWLEKRIAMKYSPSVRLINTIVFAVLFAGFAFLGIWFGFVYGTHIVSKLPIADGIDLPDISVGLIVLLAGLGFAGAIISGLGLFFSLRSLVAGGRDEPVRKAFGCYIALGALAAIFFFLNAMWLYRLTSTNLSSKVDLAFVIVVYIILLILSVIGVSVPLMHMYGEGEHTNEIMQILSLALVAVLLGAGIAMGSIYLGALQAKGSNVKEIRLKSGLLALGALVSGLVALVARIGYGSAEKKNLISKRNAFLFIGAIALSGLLIAGAGVFSNLEVANDAHNVYFMTARLNTNKVTTGYEYEFAVMSYVTGGIIFLLSATLTYFTIFPPKVKAEI